MLLEGKIQLGWEIKGRKKKNQQPSTTKSGEVTNSRQYTKGYPERVAFALPAPNTDNDKSENRNQPRSNKTCKQRFLIHFFFFKF